MRIADDATLFVLDDEGVFFSGARQELYVFNGPATFIWCCLQEDFSNGDIIRLYQDTFGVSAPDAEQHVAETLNQWSGLGYISDDSLQAGIEISLTTALGRLLFNKQLRQEFRESPHRTARKLGIRASDREAFLSLNAGALERQADRGRRWQSARRPGVSAGTNNRMLAMFDREKTLLEFGVESRIYSLSMPVNRHYYRLLGTDFCVRFSSRKAESLVHPVLAHLACKASSQPMVLDVLGGAEGYVVMHDMLPVSYCRQVEELAPRIKGHIRQFAIDRFSFFLEIHAGVVSNGEKCILLPGAPGSGKTTLTAGLVCSGFRYFSDEHALLDETSLHVWPVPVALAVKPGSVEALTPKWPEVGRLQIHLREDGKRVRYLKPPDSSIAPDTRQPVGWIIFPCYDPDAGTSMQPISRADALRRLMGECMVLPELLNEARVERLIQWMRSLECFELRMSSLDEAVGLVTRLCR